MQIFKDFDGQEWTIDLNIATARAIRARMATVDSLKDVDFLDHAAMLLSRAMALGRVHALLFLNSSPLAGCPGWPFLGSVSLIRSSVVSH